mmetsp:Transcript_6342/g.21772  ORF Transcript_6342/g.21772 Transcript_6342/m.21772 type:complete len:229 (+) Transcript_6342:810-1496(+)
MRAPPVRWALGDRRAGRRGAPAPARAPSSSSSTGTRTPTEPLAGWVAWAQARLPPTRSGRSPKRVACPKGWARHMASTRTGTHYPHTPWDINRLLLRTRLGPTPRRRCNTTTTRRSSSNNSCLRRTRMLWERRGVTSAGSGRSSAPTRAPWRRWACTGCPTTPTLRSSSLAWGCPSRPPWAWAWGSSPSTARGRARARAPAGVRVRRAERRPRARNPSGSRGFSGMPP